MPKSQFIDPNFIRQRGVIRFEDIPVNAYAKGLAEEKQNYTQADFMRIYRDMAIIREFETMLGQIKTLGVYNGITAAYPGPAHLSIGQEAAAVGQAYLLGPEDFIFGGHRNHGEILAKALSCIERMDDANLMDIMERHSGGRPLKIVEANRKGCGGSIKQLAVDFILFGAIAEILARDTGFQRGLGGSMHAFFSPFGIFPNNAIVGGSAPLAAGAALYKKCNLQKGVVVVNAGDGSLGCGPVWESLHMAAMDQHRKLWETPKNGGMPILYHISDNGYGMGGQTRGETMGFDLLARVGAGLNPQQMHAERIDGNDPLAVIDAYRRKLEILRRGDGPVLLDCVTYRLGGHSDSDTGAYREKDEIEAWSKYDPLLTYRAALVNAGIAEEHAFEHILESVGKLVTATAKLAADPEISPHICLTKSPRAIEDLMYSNEKIPSFSNRAPEVLAPKAECSRIKEIAAKDRRAVTYREAIFEPIADKFYEDASLIAYGEEVREWGGAFGVYRGLSEVLPYSRLFNAPIAEAVIAGSAVGYAMCGGRVLAEIMYADFMARAGDEIFNQMAKWRAMSAGSLKLPLVLRVSVGSRYGAQHSQEWSGFPAQIPGLKVCFPATPWEAKGLLTSALNGSDPVIFFESQRLYDTPERFYEGGVPSESYEIEIGSVNKIRSGGDITFLTVGAALYRAVEAAELLQEKYGLSADIINLHSLVPLDYTVLAESVKKTGRLLLVSDACTRGSFLNDIARNLTEFCFAALKAPPVVVGARNWITPPFEYDGAFFPQASWILDAVHEKLMPLPGHAPATNHYDTEEQMRRAKAGV